VPNALGLNAFASASISDIHAYHATTDSSLRFYYTESCPDFVVRCFGYTDIEVADELGDHLEETELRSSLALLTRIEAALRIDFETRCKRRKRDKLTREFRKLRSKRQDRVRLDELLEIWKSEHPQLSPLIKDLSGAFRFRHWLAHGRYWTPKLGRKYDYTTVLIITESVFVSFPFIEV
jgi:hypothetical protein